MIFALVSQSFICCLLLSLVLTGCTAIDAVDPGTPSASPGEGAWAIACPVTEPGWAKPPDDAAVQGSPEYGYYFVNEDSSIWASAEWTKAEEYRLLATEEGVKVGWFRPAGAALEITGQRLDARAPPLEAHIPCCYPTRFQATGLYFPTAGCWEVAAQAAGSKLLFVVRVAP